MIQIDLFWYKDEQIGCIFSTSGEPKLPLSGFYSRISKDGSRGYIGSYSESLMHGNGILFASNGVMYQGNFKNGRFHGIGTLFNQKKDNGSIIDINNFPFNLEKYTFDDSYEDKDIKYQGLFINGLPSNDWDLLENEEIQNNYVSILEGKPILKEHIEYERSLTNRSNAIKIHGNYCNICGKKEFKIDSNLYNTIEVHHIKPVSLGLMIVNPEIDLIPLCSNCHTLVHKMMTDFQDPIERLREYYKNEFKKNLTTAST